MRRRALAIFNVFTVLLGVCGVTISAVVLVGAAAYHAPAIEGRIAPVVVGWRADAARDIGDVTDLRIRGVKVRSCKYLRADMATKNENGEARDVASAWVDDPTPGSTRVVGKQDFGILRLFTSRSTPAGSTIIGVAHHSCTRFTIR